MQENIMPIRIDGLTVQSKRTSVVEPKTFPFICPKINTKTITFIAKCVYCICVERLKDKKRTLLAINSLCLILSLAPFVSECRMTKSHSYGRISSLQGRCSPRSGGASYRSKSPVSNSSGKKCQIVGLPELRLLKQPIELTHQKSAQY